MGKAFDAAPLPMDALDLSEPLGHSKGENRGEATGQLKRWNIKGQFNE